MLSGLSWRSMSDDQAHGRNRMSTPADDQDFLHELERDVRAELAWTAASPAPEEVADLPIGKWLSDPADDQRYEANLRSILGAVEALESGRGRSGESPVQRPD
jgi:hypothetical protein